MTVPLSARLDELRRELDAALGPFVWSSGDVDAVIDALLSGPLAPLLATVRDLSDAIERARALADELDARPHQVDPLIPRVEVARRLRAVLPADHEQPTDEGDPNR